MGIEFNNTFTPYNMYPLAYNGLNYASKTETEEEKIERIRKENREKAADEFLKRLEQIKNDMVKKENEYIEAPLTKKEKQILKNEGLRLEEEEIKKSESSLAASMLFTMPFLAPTLKSAIKSKKNTIELFYKKNAPHLDLFKKNPDLMINAQESMQKLEQKFFNDYKVAKGNKALIKNIAEERSLFRDMMQKALDSNNPQEIAKVTEQCRVANNVKNGRLTRLFRWVKKQPKFESRFDAVATADSAGKFASVKPPKAGTSFLRNLCSNKLTLVMTAAMAAIPVVLDWSNIKKANSIDEENAKKGKNTNYGNKQIMQTGIKGAGSALTYNITDTFARTMTKKYLGKIATKLATKIAIKGGCKILGSAIGSVVPGVGTAIGLIAGTAADYLLNKFVFSKMGFFKNSSVKEGEYESSNDEELLSKISEQYSMGNNLKKDTLALIKHKYGNEYFSNLQKMHNMTEDERNNYLAKIAQEQQQEQKKSAA